MGSRSLIAQPYLSHQGILAGGIVSSRQSGFAKVLYRNGLARSATDSEEQMNAILARLSESPGHRQYLVGIYQDFIQNANGEKCWHIRKCPRKTTPYRAFLPKPDRDA